MRISHQPGRSALALTLMGLLPASALSQITPDQANQIRNTLSERIEALTILGGDFGLAGGTFRSTGRFTSSQSTDSTLGVTKLGGAGDIGDIKPLGSLPIGWQLRVQGNIGFLDATNTVHSPLLEGDINEFKTSAIGFGGGARFWMNDQFSMAPTLMAMYGRTANSYTANSPFMQMNFDEATRVGLIGWSVDTLTLRAALNFQYIVKWKRTVITLSADPTYFHTDSLHSTSTQISVNGDSGYLSGTVDVDVPMGLDLFGHELRTGGYLRISELYGNLSSGLQMPRMNEIHGRVVLDFLNQLWKVQWLGIGVSYVWGSNINGVTGGIDATFRF